MYIKSWMDNKNDRDQKWAASGTSIRLEIVDLKKGMMTCRFGVFWGLEERSRLSGIIWQHADGVLCLPAQHAKHSVLLILVINGESILVSGDDMVTVFTNMVICDDLLSIIILRGFVADQHEVPLVAAGTGQVVHQIGAILQTSVPSVRVFFLHTAVAHLNVQTV